MSIAPPPENDRAIARAIQSGAYIDNKGAIDEKIVQATPQLDRGEGIPGGDPRDRLEKRKAASSSGR